MFNPFEQEDEPRGDYRPTQLSLIKEDDKPEPLMAEGERKFAIELVLSLKPVEGKSIRVPLLVDTFPGTGVMEAIEIAMSDRRNLNIIHAILDNPSHDEPETKDINIDEKGSVI